jgi:uroporphyrin-III C-methyltransferase
MTTGTVYLIGAGPGDPDLITVKGLKLLRQADVIIHDRLAPPELLAEAKLGAELIDAGKRPDHHRIKQDDMNVLLIEHAQQGKMVVRLKGGDPFVFGRGGEEAEACIAAGIPVVIVPGITSAISAPAYAGIPVTHREHASSFTVVTGHEDPDKSPMIDYSALARLGTLIFMMGVANLPTITATLIKEGRDPATPVVCIENGTLPHQRIIAGTLDTIAQIAVNEKLQSPAVIVIGEVAQFHETLRWWKP